MSNKSLLRARPILVTALDTLESLGGRAPVNEWMAAHPDLSSLTWSEIGKMMRALHDNGYIARDGWKTFNQMGSDGKTHSTNVTIWRLKTCHR